MSRLPLGVLRRGGHQLEPVAVLGVLLRSFAVRQVALDRCARGDFLRHARLDVCAVLDSGGQFGRRTLLGVPVRNLRVGQPLLEGGSGGKGLCQRGPEIGFAPCEERSRSIAF